MGREGEDTRTGRRHLALPAVLRAAKQIARVQSKTRSQVNAAVRMEIRKPNTVTDVSRPLKMLFLCTTTHNLSLILGATATAAKFTDGLAFKFDDGIIH